MLEKTRLIYFIQELNHKFNLNLNTDSNNIKRLNKMKSSISGGKYEFIQYTGNGIIIESLIFNGYPLTLEMQFKNLFVKGFNSYKQLEETLKAQLVK